MSEFLQACDVTQTLLQHRVSWCSETEGSYKAFFFRLWMTETSEYDVREDTGANPGEIVHWHKTATRPTGVFFSPQLAFSFSVSSCRWEQQKNMPRYKRCRGGRKRNPFAVTAPDRSGGSRRPDCRLPPRCLWRRSWRTPHIATTGSLCPTGPPPSFLLQLWRCCNKNPEPEIINSCWACPTYLLWRHSGRRGAQVWCD